MKTFLIVKGTPEDARKSAAAHGVTLVHDYAEKDPVWNETRLYADEASNAAVRAWFDEVGNEIDAFPPGTLLFFSTGRAQ